MKTVLSLVVVSVVVCAVHGWGRILADNGLSYNSWIPARRSWGQCGSERDICYKTTQCCHGFYCHRIDPNDRAVPGLCRAWRMQKQWTCLTDGDCRTGQSCKKLGPNTVQLGKCTDISKGYAKGKPCTETSDCAPGLCCQLIRTFRSGPLRICGKVTEYSKCLKGDLGLGDE